MIRNHESVPRELNYVHQNKFGFNKVAEQSPVPWELRFDRIKSAVLSIKLLVPKFHRFEEKKSFYIKIYSYIKYVENRTCSLYTLDDISLRHNFNT